MTGIESPFYEMTSKSIVLCDFQFGDYFYGPTYYICFIRTFMFILTSRLFPATAGARNWLTIAPGAKNRIQSRTRFTAGLAIFSHPRFIIGIEATPLEGKFRAVTCRIVACKIFVTLAIESNLASLSVHTRVTTIKSKSSWNELKFSIGVLLSVSTQ